MNQPTSEEINLGMLAHLLGIFTGFIGALIIYLIKKDESYYISEQCKAALNFQISYAIYSTIAGILCIVLIGIILLPILGILFLVFSIIGTVKASSGIIYKYPLTIQLLK